MMILFLMNPNASFSNPRTASYFSLYVFLFTMTAVAIGLYSYLVKNKKYTAFLWLRRCYALVLCIWVIGITYLEQISGKGLGVYCYLLPTTAALLLINPIESLAIFGGTWVMLAVLLVQIGNETDKPFGDMVNSIFVMVLALFISYRYYRQMATEFCDRETIANQYEEIQHANNMLQQMVHMDQLTGLYNRHYLLEKFYPKFKEYQLNAYTGMFLMMDIDYFKQYNDMYGHVQGDACLRRISRVVKELCSEEVAAAIRYGVEEFLVIKIVKQPFDAMALANRLWQEIEKENIPRDDVKQKRVTVSMGVWHDTLQHTEHIEAAIKSADEALYQAKSMGRNRIIESESGKEQFPIF